MSALCFSVALANTRAFDDNAGYPWPVLVPRIDKLLVDRTRRRLKLMSHNHVIRKYRISLGGADSAPAGRYLITERNAASPFHLALRLTRQSPAPAGKPLVSLQLHGLPGWLGPLAPVLQGCDWTPGGIGLANADIEEIWNLVADGTPVVIRP